MCTCEDAIQDFDQAPIEGLDMRACSVGNFL